MVKLIILALFILLVIIIVNHFSNLNATNIEGMVNIPKFKGDIKFTRNKNCRYKMSKTIKYILEKHGIEGTKKDDWALYLPCTYNNMKKEVSDADYKDTNQRLFLIDNADQLVGKNTIWKNLVDSYGRDKATKMMPRTYVLSDEDDMKLFDQEFTPKKLYILKKNIQRQEGLLITNKKKEILKGINDKFVIVQELLQDPYLIDGRKTNMRFYLLIVCKEGEIDAYVHNDGFMYYTAKKFKQGCKESGPNITTGYIDRKVYEENPLTHKDFRAYLDNHDRILSPAEINVLAHRQKISNHVFNSIYKLISTVVEGLDTKICQNSKLDNVITFQLFGVDIAVNDQLQPQIMEINKGPDLGAKGPRDKKVKYGMVEDMLKIMKILPGINHGFIKVLE